MLKQLFRSSTNKGLPDYVMLIRRPVKWARIKVMPGGQVQMVVPQLYRERDVLELFRKKSPWIDRQRAHLSRSARLVLPLEEGQILLFGKGYQVVRTVSQQAQVDQASRIIFTTKDLADELELESWYRVFARSYLAERLDQLSAAEGFQYNRLFVKNQRTRWGSCSARQNISLNWKLVKAPIFVSDYVIYHELVHTRIMDHSDRFWQRVAELSPDFRKAKAWLKDKGPWL